MGTKPTTGQQEITEVALDLAAQYKWSDVTLSQISKIAGISLSQLISLFPSKNALVVGIMEDTTKVVVNDTDQEILSERPRDRLFDILYFNDGVKIYQVKDEERNMLFTTIDVN